MGKMDGWLCVWVPCVRRSKGCFEVEGFVGMDERMRSLRRALRRAFNARLEAADLLCFWIS